MKNKTLYHFLDYASLIFVIVVAALFWEVEPTDIGIFKWAGGIFTVIFYGEIKDRIARLK
jgi:hypothetical protein